MPRVALCTWLMDVRANSLRFPNVSLNEKKKTKKINKQKINKLTMESENSYLFFVLNSKTVHKLTMSNAFLSFSAN